jgi:hypothetical protein
VIPQRWRDLTAMPGFEAQAQRVLAYAVQAAAAAADDATAYLAWALPKIDEHGARVHLDPDDETMVLMYGVAIGQYLVSMESFVPGAPVTAVSLSDLADVPEFVEATDQG